ncbi:rhomboid family intramembrane serine protease [Xanthobacter sp. V4C-4]|uniref:rhomboid family intramembrane serine protease n=1 Tax=Xanthobacter cornucopiae TaxID=3119924 RepID=UPI003726FADA
MLKRPPFPATPAREPVFNLPASIVGVALVLIAIHAVRVILLSADADLEVLAYFAFIPARYTLPDTLFYLPGGWEAKVWTPVSYALLHANWMHVGVNLIWFLAFGTPVARRFGTVRFLLFCAVTAAAGAGAHYLSYPDGIVPLIGASATVSGAMAAAMRFAVSPGGILAGGASGGDHHPAESLLDSFRNPQLLIFIAIWFGLNLLFGLGVSMPGTEGSEVAWQAHVGGFAAGLLLFGLFDPVPRRRMA